MENEHFPLNYQKMISKVTEEHKIADHIFLYLLNICKLVQERSKQLTLNV